MKDYQARTIEDPLNELFSGKDYGTPFTLRIINYGLWDNLSCRINKYRSWNTLYMKDYQAKIM